MMPDGRPEIPADLKRAVLTEAGHRCAIPTCRHNRVEFAHIIPYKDVKSHTFSNLIALCPNCHDRYDRGEIDRKSMLHYKANLHLLSNQYGDLERRVIELMTQDPRGFLKLPGSLDILVWNLVRDGYLEKIGMIDVSPEGGDDSYIASMGTVLNGLVLYRLTAAGQEFVSAVGSGRDLAAYPSGYFEAYKEPSPEELAEIEALISGEEHSG